MEHLSLELDPRSPRPKVVLVVLAPVGHAAYQQEVVWVLSILLMHSPEALIEDLGHEKKSR
jgi:hypothetical protein